MRNIFEVIRFEIIRSIKKPSFWLAAIALPVILGVYITIVAVSSYSAGESLSTISNIDQSKIAYYDASNYIKTDKYITSDGDERTLIALSSREEGIAAVKDDKYDLFFYIPENFAPEKDALAADSPAIEIYAKPEVVTLFDEYQTTVSSFLTNTAQLNINSQDLAVIKDHLNYTTVTLDKEDNHEVTKSEIISKVAGPGLAIIAFYILICVLGNRLVAAMTEEKENRISELLLTSIKPLHLITGKVISLMILGILQLFVLALPIVIVLIVAKNNGAFPEDIALQLSAGDIISNLMLLLGAYFIFTSLCVLIGVISPSAKDANSYASIVVILAILPLIFMNIFIGDENYAVMQFFSYFPPTAPLALMMRGVFSNITPVELWIGIADIFVVGALIIRLSTYIYCHNALGFNSKINLKKVLLSPRKSWKN